MPRPGPRRPAVAVRIKPTALAYIDERAAVEVDGPGDRKRSEMIRRMLAYAATNMPTGWKP